MKRYINYSIIYSFCAILGAVFYREFTKFNGFTGKTTLAVVHTHYFLLGMEFLLCCCWRKISNSVIRRLVSY